MGELTFFLGLQVKQKNDGIFISQDKYVTEILKKFGFTDVKTASTPMETQKPLLKDKDGEEVDVHLYRSMIGSLMYLTSSRPDIMFALYACARYQVNLKVSHLHAVKRIFRYLKGQPKLGLWYPKDSPFDLVAYTDSDYAGAILDKKSTTGALVDGKKIIVTEASIRSDLQLNDEEGMDCLPNATIFEELTRICAKTTVWNEFSRTMTSEIICLATNQKFNFSKYIFESMVENLDNASKFLMYPRFVQVFLDKQLEGMSSHKRIYVTPSHTKKIFGNMKRVGKGFSRRETPLFPTMVVQNQAEMGEGLAIPTNPQHTPTIIQPSTSQPQKKQRSRRPKIKDTEVPQPSGLTTNVADEVIYEKRDDSLERVATTATGLDAEQDRGNINKTQSKATPNEPSSPGTSSGGGPKHQETMGDTIAQTRSENVSKLSSDPLLARVIDLEKTKTAQAQEITSLKLRVKKLEKKGGSRTHKEDASKQGRKIDDIDKDAEITLVDETQGRYGDDIMFDVSDITVSTASTIPVSAASITDVEITLAQALVELKSAKPTTATNTRPKAKGLRAGDELEQESIKKQKVDEDKETAELKSLMEVIPDEEEVAVDAIPSATKPPSIVDWKIHKEGKKRYYQIIRANGSSKMYLVFSHMLKSFDREDFETFYKLVKAKYGSTRPVEDLDLVLYGDLKTMFDPHVEDQGRIVGIKSFLMLFEVTAAQLMLLVYKLLLSMFRVNAAIIKLQLLKRLRLLEDFLLSKKGKRLLREKIKND
ncbi:hypothetical protein Tco_0766270 [Tanacetum coccineum]